MRIPSRIAVGWSGASVDGGIRRHNHWVNVSHVLQEEYFAFEETGDSVWAVHFGPLMPGHFHEPLLRIEDVSRTESSFAARITPVQC